MPSQENRLLSITRRRMRKKAIITETVPGDEISFLMAFCSTFPFLFFIIFETKTVSNNNRDGVFRLLREELAWTTIDGSKDHILLFFVAQEREYFIVY